MYKVMIFVVFMVVCAAVGAAVKSARATDLPFRVDAQSAIVLKADTGEVVANKNGDVVRPIASITKLMTAVVTLDALLPMDEVITITHEDVVATMLHGRPYSTSLPVGSAFTRRALLQLALMNSHNRAAAALGRTYPGGVSVFVREMNKTALFLGMNNTVFVEPTGLQSANVSTANDLAILVRYAASYPDIQEMSTTTKIETQVRNRTATFGTTNRLLKVSAWNIQLQKTGYISSAGRCLVMFTRVADSPFVVVLLNTKSAYNRAADAANIKRWIEVGRPAASVEMRELNPYKRYTNRKHKKHHRRSHR